MRKGGAGEGGNTAGDLPDSRTDPGGGVIRLAGRSSATEARS